MSRCQRECHRFEPDILLQHRCYSIKALHYIGNVETQDRYLVAAPNKPTPTPDVNRVPGLSFYTALAQLDLEHHATNVGVGSSNLSGGTN